jgi:hypothetical protein
MEKAGRPAAQALDDKDAPLCQTLERSTQKLSGFLETRRVLVALE